MGATRSIRWSDVIAAITAAATLLVAQSASASPDLVLDGEAIELSGVFHYRLVRLLNGAKLTVSPYNGQPGTTTGRLELVATDILVDATSEVNATGAGYRGMLDANGEGLAGGQGALVSIDATGGGGHAGKGGNGVLLAGCAAIAGATGGAALTGSSTDVTFGSAGAAAGTADGDSGGRGGSGGGALVLRAGRIEISGKLVADGLAGEVVQDDSSGGGAGGGVLLQAAYFLSYGGRISVLGASGGQASDDEGGGGGGGRVLLLVPAIPSDLQLAIQGGAASCAAAQGGVGQAKLTASTACVDLDGDGFTSAGCGGPDCDDSDPEVNPSAEEACDGVDNDCSGVSDDHGAGASCASGQCVAGECIGEDAGLDAPAEVGLDGETLDALAEGSDEPEAEPAESGSDGEPSQQEAGLDAGADGADADAADAGQDDGRLVLRGGCGVVAGATTSRWAGLGIALAMFERIRRLRRKARGPNAA